MRFDITIDRLEAFERVNGCLQKTLDDFTFHKSRNQIKNELISMLEKYKAEFEIDEEVPVVDMQYKGNVIVFNFMNPTTDKPVLLFTEWFARRKKRSLNPRR